MTTVSWSHNDISAEGDGPHDDPAADFTDEIAVERCVAGTLSGRTLNQAERDLVIERLFRLGYSNPEIVRRAAISLKEILPILSRLGLVPKKYYRLKLRSPGDCTPEQAHRVRQLAAVHARNTNEARELLLALGLVEEVPVWLTRNSSG
jgi:hypothetical protein